MPHPASTFAEIPHGQAHELITARFELHPLQQLARAPLVLAALGREPAQILRVAGQPVAQPLQLRQRQQARAAGDLAPDLGHVRRR
jgi:hypothetical protein